MANKCGPCCSKCSPPEGCNAVVFEPLAKHLAPASTLGLQSCFKSVNGSEDHSEAGGAEEKLLK
jgi:hypothetical protein